MPEKKRIIGIDIARALAIIGMIIVNFKMVLGSEGSSWLKGFADVFDGKAAATFVVLAGLGMALMTNTAISQKDRQKWSNSRKRIIKRALFLFIIGLSYIWIWPADILHFYGIYMLISLLFIQMRPKWILIGALAMIMSYSLLFLLFDYEQGWDFDTITYLDFWSYHGFIRNLFYNGFHPVIPWTAFMLAGIWLGKQDLRNEGFVKKLMWISLGSFAFLQVISVALVFYFSKEYPAQKEDWTYLLGTSPMPPLPIYMLNGISIAYFSITGCIWLGNRFENSLILSWLNKTGQLALSFYVAHVVLGMGLIEILYPGSLGTYDIDFSVIYALAFSIACIFFAVLWLKYRKSGPLEWLMRKITD